MIVVTGGAGFVGSHLVDALLNKFKSDQIVVIDSFISSNRDNLAEALSSHGKRLSIIEHDLTDLNWLRSWGRTLSEPISHIAHLASPASPPIYQRYPEITYLVNSVVTHELVQIAKQHTAKFLFASTSEAYGNPLEHPQKEEYWGNVNPNGPRSCYDESKRLGESIVGVAVREHGLDGRIVRIFNTYGPRMFLDDGRVIPEFVKAVLSDAPLPIYGDGEQTRSFCYVSDLVQGLVALLTKDGLTGQTINIGNPGEFTINQLAVELEELIGRSMKRTHHPLPGDDPVRRRPDITKAKQILQWQPTIDLKEGLKRTLEHYEKRSSDA